MKIIKKNRKHKIFKINPNFTSAIVVDNWTDIAKLELAAFRCFEHMYEDYDVFHGEYSYKTYQRLHYLGVKDDTSLSMLLLRL